jgi:hypothetical protein
VVAIETRGGPELIDGHNRASVARDLNKPVDVLSIDNSSYKALRNQGYDNMEIAAGVLELAEEWDALSNLNSQFGGSRIHSVSSKVADAILELKPKKPVPGQQALAATKPPKLPPPPKAKPPTVVPKPPRETSGIRHEDLSALRKEIGVEDHQDATPREDRGHSVRGGSWEARTQCHRERSSGNQENATPE